MKNSIVIFRTDGNSMIGLGHIMRCLSIADAFKDSGPEILFVLADYSVEKLVSDRGYPTIILNSDHTDMDSELVKWDERNIWDRIKDDTALIIVDSYYVTETLFLGLNNALTDKSRHGGKVVYIDDLASFPYPVDVLINYNAYGSYMDYKSLYKEKPPLILLGPEYAPLRQMFCRVPKREQKRKVEDILISTGGSDTEHLAIRLVRALSSGRKEGGGYKYHLLIGALNQDREEIISLTAGKEDIVIHENVRDMKSLISDMDICVSAAGSTLYEICACGVPLITCSLADNQRPGAEAFQKLGLADNLGDLRSVSEPGEMILSAIEELSRQYEKRVEIGTRMHEMVDGRGAERIVKSLRPLI